MLPPMTAISRSVASDIRHVTIVFLLRVLRHTGVHRVARLVCLKDVIAILTGQHGRVFLRLAVDLQGNKVKGATPRAINVVLAVLAQIGTFYYYTSYAAILRLFF